MLTCAYLTDIQEVRFPGATVHYWLSGSHTAALSIHRCLQKVLSNWGYLIRRLHKPKHPYMDLGIFWDTDTSDLRSCISATHVGDKKLSLWIMLSHSISPLFCLDSQLSLSAWEVYKCLVAFGFLCLFLRKEISLILFPKGSAVTIITAQLPRG